MTDRASSAAFLALPKVAKKVLGAIVATIGNGDCATISYTDFMFIHHVGRPSISRGLKALVALGFVEIEAGPRLVNRYRLSHRWAEISEAEAARLVKAARQILPARRFEKRRDPVQPPPQPEMVETDKPVLFIERKPSMPTLRWLDAR